jgi:hypothetical protein
MTPSPARQPRDPAWIAGLVFLLFWGFFVHSRGYSSNDRSRLAAIESLVARGTWAIDGSRFSTIDQIKVGEHFYSDKPPLMALAGAGIYAVLHHGLGWQLNADWCFPAESPGGCRAALDPAGADWAYVALTFLLVALPGALLVGLNCRLAGRLGLGPGPALALAALLGLGTAVLPYSTVFVNHVPAAAAVAAAVFLLAPGPAEAAPTRGRLALAGLCAATAGALDLSALVFTLGLMVFALAAHRRRAAWFALGAAGPLALSVVLNWQIVGNPFPPQLYTAGYAYPGSPFASTVAGNRRAGNVAAYAFDLLVGRRGVLAFFPVLLVYGLWLAWALRAAQPAARRLAWAVLGSTLTYGLYFIFFTDNFGGWAYSPRWLLVPVPAVALAGLAGLAARRAALRRWHWAALAALAALSVYSAFDGARDPWRPAAPLLRLAYMAPAGVGAPPVVLAGYGALSEVDPAWRDALGANDIVPRAADPARAFVVPPEPAWWFVKAGVTPAPEFAAGLGQGVFGAYALAADLAPAARTWLARMPPPGAQSLAGPARPLRFGAEMALLGVEWRSAEGALRVVTAWEQRAQPARSDRRNVYLRLLDAAGQVVGHDDSAGVAYGALRPGDVVFQVHTFAVDGLPPGTYAITVEVYDPVAGQALPADGAVVIGTLVLE